MTVFSVVVEIQSSADTVWAVMRDVERWHEWTPSIESIVPLNPGPLTIGKRVRIRQPKVPPAVWEVTEFVEGKSFTWVTRGLGVWASAIHRVEPFSGGSRVTLSVHYHGVLGPLVAWLLRDLNHRYLNLEAAGLKRRFENKK